MILVEWFKSREDYDQVRQLFGEPADLPATFDQWRESALESIEEKKKSRVIFRNIVIDASQFTAWCRSNGTENYRLDIEAFKTFRYRQGNVGDLA